MGESSSQSLVQKILETVNVITSLGDFKIQKRECSTLTRRVKLLLPLFEEVRDLSLALSELDFDCFHALEAALDTARALLLLCSKGSKLYLVLEQGKVTRQFLSLNTALGEALDKSPLLVISDEVREQVDLVHHQFQRAKGIEDPIDTQLQSILSSAMDTPYGRSQSDLKKLAESFKFDTARALMKELQALQGMRTEKEPSLDGILGNDRGFELMFGLLNDMRILFPQDDLEQDDPELKKLQLAQRLQSSALPTEPWSATVLQVAQRAGMEKSSMQPDTVVAGDSKGAPNVPDDFKCPISLDLMRDPVIIATGQTYERSCIQKWLDSGKRTCPKTGLLLPHANLTPNHVLRSVIAEWCTLHSIELPKRRVKGSQCSPEDKAAIDELIANLSSPTVEVQRSAACDIRLRARKNVDHRICIAEQGAIPLLVKLLLSPDQETQEHAVTALLNLSINESNKARIVLAGAIEPVVEVLRSGCMQARENAAATLFSLSLVDDNKKIIGSSGAIPALVQLLHDGTARGKKDAATALFNLSIYQGNKARAVRAGVVPPLMSLIVEQPATILDEALAILAILATHHEGRIAISEVGPTPIWARIIVSESPRNKENAAAILLALCSHDPGYIKQARESGAVEPLTVLAQSRDSTSRAKRKASALLELLKKPQVEVMSHRLENLHP